jgi:trimethylguanosine synthase
MEPTGDTFSGADGAELAELVGRYSARLCAKAAAAAGQAPLLPVALEPGFTVAVVRRSSWWLEGFFGHELPPDVKVASGGARASSGLRAAGACALRILETSLVHYTPRPKERPLAGAKRAAALAAQEESKGGESVGGGIDKKYWKRRYNYFARFDEGVRMDPAAWFEVTPESVARHIADRMPFDMVVDGTCGVGGNAIQFAMTSQKVVAVDTDAGRLDDAAHNAAVYGVQGRIQFVHDDFVHFARSYSGPPVDAVFLSPPWGGPGHLDTEHFSLKDVECPDIVDLFSAAVSMSPRVVLYLPRHVDLHEIALLAYAHGFPAVEVEKVLFQYPTRHLKLVVVYFTPEASAAAPSSIPTSTTKTVDSNRRRGPPAATSRKKEGEGGATWHGLLGLPPLAGPLIRALYCRHHYLGRYVVALAMAVERDCAAAGTAAAASRAASRPGSRARRCLPGPGGGGPPGRVQEGPKARALSRREVAKALCEALRALASEGASDEETVELVDPTEALLADLALADAMRLVVETATAASCSGGTAASVSSAAPTTFMALAKERFPAIFQKMLEQRKGAVLNLLPTP